MPYTLDPALLPHQPQSLRPFVRGERHWVVCNSCRLRHAFYGDSPEHVRQQFLDFSERHPKSAGCHVLIYDPDDIRRVTERAQRRRRAKRLSVLDFHHNADVKLAFGTETALDLTSFNSLASSATAGWSSHYIDNSSNLYVEVMFGSIKIAAVNTAPGSDKCFYPFVVCSNNTTDLPCSGASSGNTVANSSTTSATLTFPSVATLPCLFRALTPLQYPVQNITNTHGAEGIAAVLNGRIGKYIWFPMVNYSGMTIAASGNVINYSGGYLTVV